MIGKSKKKILILGSRGQIGSSLEVYLKKKYNVEGVDILNGKNEDLRSNSNKIQSLIKNTDFVFFLAFDVGGSRYMDKYQNSYVFIMNNVQIMANTFSILKKNKKKFIFATSQMSNMLFSSYGILKKIGENGKKKYHKYFNNKLICDYIIKKNFGFYYGARSFFLFSLKYVVIKLINFFK